MELSIAKNTQYLRISLGQNQKPGKKSYTLNYIVK